MHNLILTSSANRRLEIKKNKWAGSVGEFWVDHPASVTRSKPNPCGFLEFLKI
jgi:hypothetical protein